jgi:hypothetical protein
MIRGISGYSRLEAARAWVVSRERLPTSYAQLFVVVLAGLLASAAWGDAMFPNMPSSFFPIGVYYQPADAVGTTSFAGWAARGVNTLIGYEPQSGDPTPVTIDQYSQAAVNAGMYMIREPRSNPAADIGQANLLAWLQPDEPEGNGVPASTLQNNYNTWQAADPNMPVMVNFDGSRIVGWQGGLSQANYAPYIQAADLLSEDIYPVTGWLNPGALNIVGQAVSTLQAYTSNTNNGVTKPIMAIIETSNQRLFADSEPQWAETGVTPGQFRAELWDALIHGAKAITYFPQSFNSFRYDATPIDVAAEMTRQDTIIEGLAPVLNSSDTPDVTSVTLTGGTLEAMTRAYLGVTYIMVLNESNSTVNATMSAPFTEDQNGLQVLGEGRTLPYTGDGSTFTDSFSPYGVHIYAEAPSGSYVVSVPEPATALPALIAILISARSRRRSGRAAQAI